MKVERAIVVTLTSALALALHFKVLHFYAMGKVLSGDLSCTWTGLALNMEPNFLQRKANLLPLFVLVKGVNPVINFIPS